MSDKKIFTLKLVGQIILGILILIFIIGLIKCCIKYSNEEQQKYKEECEYFATNRHLEHKIETPFLGGQYCAININGSWISKFELEKLEKEIAIENYIKSRSKQ